MPEQGSQSSRRNFLKAAGLFGGSSLLLGCGQKATSIRKVKNVIFLVADGMGNGTFSLAQCWSERLLGGNLHWLDLYRDEKAVRSVQDTASANSVVTDSAAAASAWGGGERVNNGAVNITPDGRKMEPLGLVAKKLGKALGLVTTTRVTHATPAGFIANVLNRGLEEQIADQYLQRGVDVCLGGGKQFFNTERLQNFSKRGYNVVSGKQELAEVSNTGKVLGLFSDSHIPYAIDRQNQSEHTNVPSLEEMFTVALKNLEKKENGFLLQVEGGRVDHAGHVNDPGAIIQEILEFDRCIPIALDYVKKHPDTLLVVTTDHGTGGCQMNGVGGRYTDTNSALAKIAHQKGSFKYLEAQFLKLGRYDASLFEQITGLESREAAVDKVNEVIAEGGKLSSLLADLYADEILTQYGVGWTSHNHTAENVDLLAYGAGAENFPPLLKNMEVYHILRDLMSA